ncbi:hypothetical protein ACTFIW_000906 [Dictyostelium discoideum]
MEYDEPYNYNVRNRCKFRNTHSLQIMIKNDLLPLIKDKIKHEYENDGVEDEDGIEDEEDEDEEDEDEKEEDIEGDEEGIKYEYIKFEEFIRLKSSRLLKSFMELDIVKGEFKNNNVNSFLKMYHPYERLKVNIEIILKYGTPPLGTKEIKEILDKIDNIDENDSNHLLPSKIPPQSSGSGILEYLDFYNNETNYNQDEDVQENEVLKLV